MNILVFSWRDPKHPLAGGAEQSMHEHMKGWVEAGHKVTLFSSKVSSLSKRENIEGIEIVRSGCRYLGVQIAGFFFYLRNKNKFDFLVDQFHGVPFFTPLYSDKPILAVIQEPAREVWFKNPLKFPINYIVGVLGYIFEPVFFLFYKNTPFMTGSESAKNDVSKLGISPNKITVVPHGVIGPKDKFNINQKRKAITFLGTLSKDKGIEDALKCFSIFSKEKNYEYWIIGKAETEYYYNFLIKRIKQFGLKDIVKLWGRVDEKKKFELLTNSYVLINPSIHEGWGLVNIEANLVGTPVISYKSAGLVDSVRDEYSGILVRKNNPKNLASEVLKLILNEKRYRKMQITSVLWSKRFNWQKSRKLSLKLINSLVS